MSEEKVQPAGETNTTEPVQAETQTPVSVWDDFENALDSQILKDNPEAKAHLDKINTKSEVKESVSDVNEQLKAEEDNEEKPVADFSLPKLKLFGEEVTLDTAVKKYPQLFETEELQKKIAFTQKMQEVSEREKTLAERQGEFEEYAKQMQLENLSYKIGQPFTKKRPLESQFIDPLADEDERAQQIDNYNKALDEYDKEFNEYRTKAQTYYSNIQHSNQENEKNAKEFQSKYKLSDEDLGNLAQRAKSYLNASTSAGQIPFPPDTLEILYKGLNYETLTKSMKEEYETKLKEAKQQGYDEALMDVKGKKPVFKEKVKNSKSVDTLPELNMDIINQFNGQHYTR